MLYWIKFDFVYVYVVKVIDLFVKICYWVVVRIVVILYNWRRCLGGYG